MTKLHLLLQNHTRSQTHSYSHIKKHPSWKLN